MIDNTFTVLTQVYGSCPPLSNLRDDHDWVLSLQTVNATHVRLLRAYDLRTELDQKNIEFFIKDQQALLLIPTMFMGFHSGFVLRSLTSKAFRSVTRIPFVCYSSRGAVIALQNKQVRYGLPFLFSEGVLEAEFLAQIYPLSFSMLNNRIYENLAVFLSYYTDRVIYVQDHDESGEKGKKFSFFGTQKAGISLNSIRPPHPYKDAGDILKAQARGKDVVPELEYFKKAIANLL